MRTAFARKRPIPALGSERAQTRLCPAREPDRWRIPGAWGGHPARRSIPPASESRRSYPLTGASTAPSEPQGRPSIRRVRPHGLHQAERSWEEFRTRKRLRVRDAERGGAVWRAAQAVSGDSERRVDPAQDEEVE